MSKLFNISIMCLLFSISGCIAQDRKLTIYDIDLFKGEVWDLALAVDKEDTLTIEKIIQEKRLKVDFQEPKFGTTLLIWAVFNNRYYSAKTLLKNGANPNLQKNDGTSAFMYSAAKNETSKYVELLLSYGGNPNAVANNTNPVSYRTPLFAAAGHNLESVKLLVEAGADINYISENDLTKCALLQSIISKKPYITHFLLVEKNANFNNIARKNVNGIEIRIGDWLRDWTFPLDSEEYKIKMKIVEYLLKYGENYWSTPIPNTISKQYPKEYLEKY